MAQLIHWNLFKKYESDQVRHWHAHTAEKIMGNKKVIVLWNFTIQTDHVIQTRRLDFAAKEKEMDHTWIIVTAMPGYSSTEEKKRESGEVPRSGKKNIKIVENISKCKANCGRSTRGSRNSR